MIVSIVLFGALVIAGLALVVRYGADSRDTGDPTGRDPGWPSTPTREHTPREDVALVRAWLARVEAHRRCWALLERSLTPWEASAPARTGTSRA